MARNWSLPICPPGGCPRLDNGAGGAGGGIAGARGAYHLIDFLLVRTFSIACSRVSNHSIGTTLRQFPRCCPRLCLGRRRARSGN